MERLPNVQHQDHPLLWNNRSVVMVMLPKWIQGDKEAEEEEAASVSTSVSNDSASLWGESVNTDTALPVCKHLFLTGDRKTIALLIPFLYSKVINQSKERVLLQLLCSFFINKMVKFYYPKDACTASLPSLSANSHHVLPAAGAMGQSCTSLICDKGSVFNQSLFSHLW